MENEKIEELLNISMQVDEELRKKVPQLNSGIEDDDDWEIIVKYSGSLDDLKKEFTEIKIYQLINNYAILNVKKDWIDRISQYPQVKYIEKSKNLMMEEYVSQSGTCINQAKIKRNLDGRGVIVAILDSGIDITLDEFKNEDGSSRILYLLDLTKENGTEYDNSAINKAIEDNEKLGIDISNHGTPIAAIACGNNGVANKSDIIIVKLGVGKEKEFTRTTQVMKGLDYVIRKAEKLKKPVAVNLSFGNTYGSHKGNTILEQYINDIEGYWKSVICIGTGNEAGYSTHAGGILQSGEEKSIEIAVGRYQPAIDIQLWKNYFDEINITLVTPANEKIPIAKKGESIQKKQTYQMDILINYGSATPYSIDQEIYIALIPKSQYILSGIWKIELEGEKIKDGNYDVWLPSGETLNNNTFFTRADPYNTFTIPSTAQKVISVGAYNNMTGAYAIFSGRGSGCIKKPEIVAPGVNISTYDGIGGIREFTGTSFATPYVTGSAALLLQWGIINKNDIYLYGEKVKAYLIKGAQKLEENGKFSYETGYGALCLEESIPVI